MSSLYEQWKPAVEDRVRIVERNEQGAATQTGESGTIVALHPDKPEALCEVRYDASDGKMQRHAAAELEPIGTKDDASEPWVPTVGDRVMVPGGREATVTSIEERPERDGLRGGVQPPAGRAGRADARDAPALGPDADEGALGGGG